MDRPASPLTDRQLLERTARHDGEAFGALYDRYSKPLYNYLLRLVGREGVAEELLQEAYIAAWNGAGRFRGRSKVSTWLFRIAHHKAVDWLRRVRPNPVEELERLPADDCPEAEAFEAWTAGRLRSALAELSPEHRAVLELTFYHGFSYREIARIVDCPVGTVKSRMSYAKATLRGILERMGVRE
jgi:RNA polymerase sigma-70 factor (ECF subfamily)